MRKVFLAIAVCLFLVSCKNKETRVFEFAQDFNKDERKIKDPDIKQNKAYYLDKNTVNLDYIINSESVDSLVQTDKDILKRILPISFQNNPNGKELIDEGVNITVRIFNKSGMKIKELPLKDYNINDL